MKKPYIIAETACSHDGSILRLKKMIDHSIKAGFSAIQFQIWKHQNIIDPNDKSVKKLKKIEIDYKSWKKIISYTKKKIEIIACIYDLDAFRFCYKEGIRIFKIHTADLSNELLIREISKKAKRIDLSVGASTEKEISNALKHIKNKCKVWIMYGIQLFPTDPKSLNLKYLLHIKKKYRLPVGYQDHSKYDLSGFTVPTTAIGLGVNIIEKHITDKNSRNGTDGESAIEIKNYDTFIQKCNEAYISLGKGIKNSFSKTELIYRDYSKKKILLKKAIPKGKKIEKNDIIFLRSNKRGATIDKIKEILGKKAIKNLKKFETLDFNKIK